MDSVFTRPQALPQADKKKKVYIHEGTSSFEPIFKPCLLPSSLWWLIVMYQLD